MLTVESIESPQVKPVKVQAVDDVEDPLVVVFRGRVRDLVLAVNVTKTFYLLRLLQIKLECLSLPSILRLFKHLQVQTAYCSGATTLSRTTLHIRFIYDTRHTNNLN